MKPSFYPRLINQPFSDPGLFISFLHEKRALLFDLGNLSRLSARDLLRVTHVFVTHTHMDHFIGFDNLLRVFLGRDKTLHLFGPPNFFKNVEGKLAGYTWNLIRERENGVRLLVSEVHPDKILTKTYLSRECFQAGPGPFTTPFSGYLIKEPSFSIEASLLDHRIPCLGLSMVENFHVNIIKEELMDLGLPVGPWLGRLKSAIRDNMDPEACFIATWEEPRGVKKEKSFRLGDLINKVVRITPGQKITYITDVLASPDNCRKIVELAYSADILFIEGAFLESEKESAEKKYHLTAREAGDLARKAEARHMQLFHFSPRYIDRAEYLEREAKEAYEGNVGPKALDKI